jgi:F-type H+-transporting ATPase subunit beta
VHRARRLERFLTQPFAVTEAFTGREGRPVPIEATLDGCEQILNDAYRDVPERALYMIGRIREADRARQEQNPSPADAPDPSNNADHD